MNLICIIICFDSNFSNILEIIESILAKATSKTWTQTLGPDPEKSGPWKTWTLKNMDPEKHGIIMGLKNMSDFR